MSYVFNHADHFSLAIFSAFSLLMLLLMLFTFHKSAVSRKVIVGFLTYLAVFFLVIYLNLVLTYFIPIAPLLFLSVLAGSVYLSFSKVGLQISDTFSFTFLIGVQVFRLPLELILHHWVNIKTIPETMTWTGQNWDIVSGLVSLIALPFVSKNRKVVWVAQILGFSLLLNVLRVVILSSPLPFAWELENPLLLMAYLPYALIGPLFVGVALTFHLIVFRKLLRR
jgi:hypothetical protein